MDLKEIGINRGIGYDSVQDRDYWRALVNAALNFRVAYTMELVSNSACSSFTEVRSLSRPKLSLRTVAYTSVFQ